MDEKVDRLLNVICPTETTEQLNVYVSTGNVTHTIPIDIETTVLQLKRIIYLKTGWDVVKQQLEFIQPVEGLHDQIDDDNATVVSYGIEGAIIEVKRKFK